MGADETWFEGELTSSDEFTALLDTLWPTVSPAALVRDLLSSRAQLQRHADGLLSDSEWQLLLRPREVSASSTAWSVDDLALLDEATFLTGGRTRSYGHVVVDEAQDLTPMQFRMIARRAPSGSITVLGDLAQATGPWAYADWREIRLHLPETAPSQHDELTLGYRAPGKVLDFASRLLPRGRSRYQPHGVHPPGPHRARRAHRGARSARHRCAGRGTHASRASTRWSPSSPLKSSRRCSPAWPGATPTSGSSNSTP